MKTGNRLWATFSQNEFNWKMENCQVLKRIEAVLLKLFQDNCYRGDENSLTNFKLENSLTNFKLGKGGDVRVRHNLLLINLSVISSKLFFTSSYFFFAICRCSKKEGGASTRGWKLLDRWRSLQQEDERA
jgi:hypothetical protein